MACNAWNHRADCTCKFKEGHVNSRPPHNAKWSIKSYSSYLKQHHQTCGKCGARVFYVSFKSGGGGFFDYLGKPWTRHGCLIEEEVYTLYTKKGIPRLRLIKSDFERDGWTPLFDIKIGSDMLETIITASSLDSPNTLAFSTEIPPLIDPTKPTYFRRDPKWADSVEIAYFDEIDEIPRSLFAKLLKI